MNPKIVPFWDLPELGQGVAADARVGDLGADPVDRQEEPG